MIISVYADTTGCFTDKQCDVDNTAYLNLPKEMIREYFMKYCLEDFRGDDTEVSDDGLFEEWLDEYTNDDTIDLCGFLKEQKISIRKVLEV